MTAPSPAAAEPASRHTWHVNRARAIPLLVLCALTVSACAHANEVQTSPTSQPSRPTDSTSSTSSAPATSTESAAPSEPTETTTTATTTPKPALAGRPKVGNCYVTRRDAFRRHRDGSAPVKCRNPHTAETFAVFSGDAGPAAVDKAWRDCQPRFKRYVGDSSTVSTLGLTVMLPSKEQVLSGQHWIRCDALELPSYNVERGLRRQGRVEDALSGSVPKRFRGCALHWPRVTQKVHFTPCTRRHQAELIPASTNLGAPDDPFPGRATTRKLSKKFCESTFQDFVPQTRRYYYYFPTAGSWRAGTHDTTCWALDVHGDGLPPI